MVITIHSAAKKTELFVILLLPISALCHCLLLLILFIQPTYCFCSNTFMPRAGACRPSFRIAAQGFCSCGPYLSGGLGSQAHLQQLSRWTRQLNDSIDKCHTWASQQGTQIYYTTPIMDEGWVEHWFQMAGAAIWKLHLQRSIDVLFSAWPGHHVPQSGDRHGQKKSPSVQICWKYAGPVPQIQLVT